MRKVCFLQTLVIILILAFVVMIARLEFLQANPGEQSFSSQDTRRCLLCHNQIASEAQTQRIKLDHTPFVEKNIDCSSCHKGIIRGEGEVFSDSCFTCHASEKFLGKMSEPEYIHRIHVRQHKIDCGFCHQRIIHPEK